MICHLIEVRDIVSPVTAGAAANTAELRYQHVCQGINDKRPHLPPSLWHNVSTGSTQPPATAVLIEHRRREVDKFGEFNISPTCARPECPLGEANIVIFTCIANIVAIRHDLSSDLQSLQPRFRL